MTSSESEEHEEKYDYAKLLKQPEWRAKRDEILAKSPECQKCGCRNCIFAVHHRYYVYGLDPWEYPDEAYMVVCSGKCHREADADRVEQEENAEIHRRYGWQGALGKQCQMPSERELRRLASHEPEFRTWLWRERYLREPWDWNLHPLWELWNVLSSDFLAKRANYDPQGYLEL